MSHTIDLRCHTWRSECVRIIGEATEGGATTPPSDGVGKADADRCQASNGYFFSLKPAGIEMSASLTVVAIFSSS